MLEVTTASKACRDCGDTLPLGQFGRRAHSKDGHHHSCKPCTKEQRRRYHEAARDKNLAAMRAYRQASSEAIRDAQRRWRESNREYDNAYHRAWRAAHPDSGAESARLWREINADRMRERHRAWKQANADKVRGYTLARRSRLRGAEGGHSHADWLRMCRIWEWRCAYCSARPPLLTRDHVIPLSRGGSDHIGNIRPACMSCNAAKRDKTPSEWRWSRCRTVDTAAQSTPPL